jgi:hypothetical protein
MFATRLRPLVRVVRSFSESAPKNEHIPKDDPSPKASDGWLRVADGRTFSELTVAEKGFFYFVISRAKNEVVETSKDVGSLGIIVAGLGLAGLSSSCFQVHFSRVFSKCSFGAFQL